MDYVFRNIKPWPGDVKEESEYLPKCCEGHNLKYTDFKLVGDGSITTEKMLPSLQELKLENNPIIKNRNLINDKFP